LQQKGNKLEIHTAADGSTCDKWAYYRRECGLNPTPVMAVETTAKASPGTEERASGGYMSPGTAEEITNWCGVIKSTGPGGKVPDRGAARQ